MDEIRKLSILSEHEDHIEFKRAKHNYPFAGGSKSDIRERRKCVLGFGLIKEDGYYKYVLGDGYFSGLAVVKSGDVSAEDVSALYNLTARKGRAAMSDYAELFAERRTLKQTRLFIQKCVGLGLLTVEGEGRMTRYQMGDVVS